jgi:hypothetical protein
VHSSALVSGWNRVAFDKLRYRFGRDANRTAHVDAWQLSFKQPSADSCGFYSELIGTLPHIQQGFVVFYYRCYLLHLFHLVRDSA